MFVASASCVFAVAKFVSCICYACLSCEFLRSKFDLCIHVSQGVGLRFSRVCFSCPSLACLVYLRFLWVYLFIS